MDAVTPSPEDRLPRSAEIIDLAAWRHARELAQLLAPRPEPADRYPWAYTFRGPEPG